MKLLLPFLLLALSYHYCTGYPVGEDDTLTENETSFEFWLDSSNETASNDFSTLDMHGFFKKVVDKVKDKLKDFNKIKDKIKDCKDLLKFITFSVAEEISEDIPTENGTVMEYWSDLSNDTVFNGSLPSGSLHGFFKKVVDKVKNKVKDGFNKIKDKFKNCKDILKVLTFSDTVKISEDDVLENEHSIEYWFSTSNETTFNDSVPLEGFGKKVVNKVKDGIKTAKDGFNKVKDKVKDKLNKVKDKFNDFKDKIGSKGGSGGGSKGGSGGSSGGGSGYYRDKYDRDRYDRDRYNRDYDRKGSKSSGGSGGSDPAGVWFLVAFGILSFVVIVVSVIYYKTKD